MSKYNIRHEVALQSQVMAQACRIEARQTAQKTALSDEEHRLRMQVARQTRRVGARRTETIVRASNPAQPFFARATARSATGDKPVAARVSGESSKVTLQKILAINPDFGRMPGSAA